MSFEVRFLTKTPKEQILVLEGQTFLPEYYDIIIINSVKYDILEKVISYDKNIALVYLTKNKK
jgi:hypothetical protein